jgi:hypothetical protein
MTQRRGGLGRDVATCSRLKDTADALWIHAKASIRRARTVILSSGIDAPWRKTGNELTGARLMGQRLPLILRGLQRAADAFQ